MTKEEAEKTYPRKEMLKGLMTQEKKELINDLYNRIVRDRADYDEKDKDVHGHGKRIPYIGWFWRDANFVDGIVPIADCERFIGIIESNKWDYPERNLTKDEFNKFMELLEKAMSVSWGSGDDMNFYTEARFNELWDWFQTLTVK